jgi:outer membrane lipoprotein carrier protein
VCGIAALRLGAADSRPSATLAQLLKSIENHYNRPQTLKLSFTETYTGTHRPVQEESGTLVLRRPGRMRWDYSSPAGKVFLSDGKDVYLYSPDDSRAQKSKLKQSDDMRAPLAFLLGNLDFGKEFRSFESRSEGADTWITAEPKSRNLMYSKVEFLAAPSGEIRQVRITGQDQSKLSFVISGEQLNVPAAAGLFVFHPPPGVAVVEADQ